MLVLEIAFLFVSLLQLSLGQETWSGLVNSPTDDFDYQCPDGSVVVGLASLFRTAQLDRQWEYQCGSGLDNLANVSTTCTLQSPIEALGVDIDYQCPDDGYIGGFHSEFDSSVYDRRWSPYCCNRPFAALVDCLRPETGWENNIRNTLNFTAPDGHVVAGFTSFFFNRDRRWRYTTCAVEVNCTDPGVPDNSNRVGDTFLYGDSVTYTCNHGYYQSDGAEDGVRVCQQDGTWSDTAPVCTACMEIENCADIRCTNTTDHICYECESHRGEALGEAAYRNLDTECLPLCSWLQGFCYPGSCMDDLSSCNCSTGFDGPDCLNITVPSDLLSCSLTLWTPEQELVVDCSISFTSSSDSIFTNIVPQELRSDWLAQFSGPSPLTAPAYVEGSRVGVASSNIHTFLYRAANPQESVSMVTLSCSDPAPSRDLPPELAMCTSLADSTHLANHTFLHGDTFVIEATVINGGYLDVRNLDSLDSATATTRHYYTGTPVVGAVEFVLDVNPPIHCSLTSSSPCIVGQAQLEVGPGITSNPVLSVAWGGWIDEPAGVIHYSIDIYRLLETEGSLNETWPPVAMVTVNDTNTIDYAWSTNLTEGAFSVVMKVQDLAGNVRYSRRLLLIDYTSELVVDNTTASVPLRVESAVPETNYQWVNSTTAPVIITGRGHFYNTHLRHQDLLAPVADFIPEIADDYDHPLNEGLYPRSGTPNALGVTRLLYQITSDSEGGDTLIDEPSIFSLSTGDLALEGAVVETGELSDGDSIRVWFQAWDYVDHSAVDSILFHVDSSPPQLEDLWLEWNGVQGLSLHGTESLLDLRIQFKTQDPHSGVMSMVYWIGMEPETSDVASGQIPVQRETVVNCSDPLHCICSPLMNCSLISYSFSPLFSHFSSSSSSYSNLTLHDTEYYITVMVTNHAHLSSTLTHKITTDVTPPLTGVVMDAEFGSHDLDYTQNTTLAAWWADFFDRETSILIFQYHFGTECANESNFIYPLPGGSVVMETTDNWARWSAPGPGMYFVTVVAVNHALHSSHPACSDGIIIDQSVPVISNIVIPDVMVTDEVVYISTDTHINISWNAVDNVGIHDYQVAGLSEEAWSEGQSPNFTSTGRHSFFSLANSDLLSNGNTFYIVVKAIDLAMYESELTFGPVRVDITPPVVVGENITVETSRDHVTVTWLNDTFTDTESGIESLDFSLGYSEYGSQLLDFSPLSSSSSSSLCSSPHCLSLHLSSSSSSSLPPLISGHTYFITLRARNFAGLDAYSVTEGFVYIHGPPAAGRVVDLDPHNMVPQQDTCLSLHDSDTDLILDSDWLAARWDGFSHAHLEVTFSVGLGSIPGGDNVVPFSSVGTETKHSFTNLTLQSGEEYYVTVVASNEYGSTTAMSDGFTFLSGILGTISSTTVADGNDDGIDIDYQYSVTSLSAQWVWPDTMEPHLFSHYLWAVYERDVDMEDTLIEVRGYENVGSQTQATANGLELRPGATYISGVRICLSTPDPTCLAPVYSNGVLVLDHPLPGDIHAVFTPLEWNRAFSTSSYGKLDIEWSPFQDQRRMPYYQWSIGTGEPGNELLTEWSTVEWHRTRVNVFINTTLSLHKTNTVVLRGFNAAGLYSSTAVELEWNVDGVIIPQNLVPRQKLVVYDIPESEVRELDTTDWRLLEYSEWDPIGMELDYTNSAHSLSAAWPDLRYTSYNYSVTTTPTYPSHPCAPSSDLGVLACGTTIANSVTVPDLLNLQNGIRYYVCVESRESFAIHPSSSSSSSSIFTACSNGITIDLTPPTGSCVQIQTLTPTWESDLASGGGVASGGGGGSGLANEVVVGFQSECVGNGSEFQSSSSDLHIVWSPFNDVEWYGNAVHISGIAYYEYAIGSRPGDDDVVPFTKVGVVNDVIATGLKLQSGHTYYASVRAHDFTGQWSDVTSPGVTIDQTPPTGHTHFDLINTDSTYSSVPLFQDAESGVSEMRIGLGSRPGSSDLMEWTGTSYGNGIETYIQEAEIEDGQLVFATVQVWNGAGLMSTFHSLGHTHDSTPPTPGTVYDTLPSGDLSRDIDHTHFLSELSGRWSEWSDPHTPIIEYYWAIGSSPFSNDVQNFLSVGVATVGRRKGLSLRPGDTYYITVRGCNLIGRCSESSSNGITVDVTPPITGWIRDGLRGRDLQYQSSRSYIAAHWSGFHDAESSLHSYILSAGTSPGDETLLSPISLPPSTLSFIQPLSHPLPDNITLFINIVAIGNSGGHTSATSDGVFVDGTIPVVSNVTVDTVWSGSHNTETQFSNSAIRVTWNSGSPLSPIHSNTWRIQSQPGTAIPLYPQNVNSQESGTESGLTLKDGGEYEASVTTCSATGLCSQSQTHTSILVDGSPPVDGYFAVQTDSTFPRAVAIPDGTTWRNRQRAGDTRITLSFYGFSDVHSGISEYWVEIGTGFGLADLSEGPHLLSPTTVDAITGSNTATVDTLGHVTINQTIYVSLWALNGVGLPSRRVHGGFVVEEEDGEDDRGTLRLLRSSLCPLESCLGHCACAARGDLCHVTTDDVMLCEEVSDNVLGAEFRVGVVNVSPQQQSINDPLFTSLSDKLLGTWMFPDPIPYQRMEWTVGELGGEPGDGLFDPSTDQIWREIGNSSSAIFSVNPNHPLIHGETYLVYVRCWFNYTHYVVFGSDGITVDISGPTVVPGGRVREGGLVTEIDHSDNQTSIDVSWTGVFVSELTSLYSYQIGIGDVPGSDNVLPFSLISNPSPSSLPISSLSLSINRNYYTTLRAVSPLSVAMDTISDGFIVDTSSPKVGVVFDRLDYHDDIAQSNVTSLSARWIGFHDPESGIHHYEVGWSDSLSPPSGTEYENIGIRQRWTITGLNLEHGTTYYIHVAAVNGAGVWSDIVSSNGITVDATRPEQLQCIWEPVDLTSFESISSGASPCNDSSDVIVDEAITLLPQSSSFTPFSGCVSHQLTDSLSLLLPTSPDSGLYSLSFWLTRQPGSGCGYESPQGVRVTIGDGGGVDEVVLVHTRNEDILERWNRFQFQFTANDNITSLTLSPLSHHYSVVFDDLLLSRCHSTVSIPFHEVINNNRSSVFRVGQEHVSGRWTRLRVGWELGDQEEEEVVRYMWAVGTTEGGEQLQSYTSTGSTPHGVTKELSLFHSESFYISVVVWNQAGTETVVYSGPYIVDLTPPELREGGVVRDGVGGVDLEYQSSAELQSDWSDVIDPESGIEECGFMIGTSAGEADLYPYTPSSSSTSSSPHVTLDYIPHGTLVVTTVTCRNGAGLQSTFSTNGVVLLQTPPTNTSAYLAISSPHLTVYESRDNHVSSDNVTLRWGGFVEPAGHPLHYEVCIGDNYCEIVGSDRQLVIDGVGGASEEEEVSVTAINLAGLRSSPLRGRIVFQTIPPNDTGADVNVTWIDSSTLHVDWSGKFTSSSPLTFELSIGTTMGSGIIRKWVELETGHTHYTLSDVRLTRSQDYFFLSLIAISRSGLHTTSTVMESGLPLNN